MFCIENNEKNKSAVILNPERSEWVSRSHVTSVEAVVNDGAKTKCYSAKRDLYGDFAYAQPLKMTEKALFFLRLRGASGAQGISAPASCHKAHKRRFIFNSWLLHFAFTPLRMTIPTLVLLLSLNISESWAVAKCPVGTTFGTDCWSCGDDCTAYFSDDTSDNGNKKLNITGSGKMTDFQEYSDIPWFNLRNDITSANISGIDNVGSLTFAGASNLTGLDMPNVTSIGRSAFYNATSLESVDMPNVISIGDSAFYNVTSLESVDMPKVTELGRAAFYRTTSLESVYMPNVSIIGRSAFGYASSLTSVDMPNVISIGDSAFYDTRSMNYIGLPENWQVDVNGYYLSNPNDPNSRVELTPKNENDCDFSGGKWDTDAGKCYAGIYTNSNPSHLSTCGIGGTCGACSGQIISGRGCVTSETCETTSHYYWNGEECARREAITSPLICATGYLAKDGSCAEESACSGEYIVDETNGTCIKMPGCVDFADGACGGCERGFYKKEGGCVSSEEGCGAGYLEKDSVCISSANGCGAGYKDMGGFCNRIQYTPAEAAQVLHDDNTNSVTITFRK